jgi:hypothetical protein
LAADEGDEGMTGGNPHWGATLGEFLAEDGIRETARAEALTRVVAWQLIRETERQGFIQPALAD